VGKSSLLLQLMDVICEQDSQANIIYISKELFEYDALRDYKDLMKVVSAQSKQKKKIIFSLTRYKTSKISRRPYAVCRPKVTTTFTSRAATPFCLQEN
jgi:hypothetical protein